MSIKLREGESIGTESHLHWSAFLLAKVWAALGLLAFLGVLVRLIAADASSGNRIGLLLGIAIVCFVPLVYKWLSSGFRHFTITNQRVFVEAGLLNTTKNDIPLNKINEVTLHQNLLQRMVGTGTIVIQTGNDSVTVISGIDDPERFNEVLSKMMSQKATLD